MQRANERAAVQRIEGAESGNVGRHRRRLSGAEFGEARVGDAVAGVGVVGGLGVANEE